MTDLDLSGCRTKLARARRHVEDLRDAYGRRPFSCSLETRPSLFGDLDVVVVGLDEPPAEWAAIIGDAVHNMRSALDHLVCALARAADHDCDKTSFIVLWKTKDISWWGDVTKWQARWRERASNRLAAIREEDRELFESVQPYHAFWPDENLGSVAAHPLAQLERLWNTDKHRLLTPGLYAIEEIVEDESTVVDAEIIGRSMKRAPLKLGDVTFTIHWRITGPDPSIRWRGNLRPRLAFQGGQYWSEGGSEDVLSTLDKCHAFVTDLVGRVAATRGIESEWADGGLTEGGA